MVSVSLRWHDELIRFVSCCLNLLTSINALCRTPNFAQTSSLPFKNIT
ncbi:unnamed protein product [Anisakis simplex]|uniref:Uncharacterized protein n=1 Tax=Anisakis simplex TaxID=6269 RepID=A0A0M3JIJ1_ANISI|nr:unnamed protein product [Anisakis simplex]